MRDFAVNVVAGLAVAAILAIAAALWESELSLLWDASPSAFAALCALSLAVGLLLGAVAGRLSRRYQAALEERRIERERKQAEEARKRARVAESEREFREEPSGEKKAMAAAVYRWPGHVAVVNGAGASEIEGLENAARMQSWTVFFTIDAKGADWYYVHLVDWLLELFEERPGIIDEFPADALAEADSVLRRFEPW